MNLKQAVKNGIEIVKLNESAMRSVAGNKNNFVEALLILIIAGIASAIGQLNPVGIVIYPIGFLIGEFTWIGILWLIAMLLGGKGSYSEYFKTLVHADVAMWITVIPFIGPLIGALVGLWLIVVAVVITKTIHKLSTLKAVLVILIPIIIILVLVFLFAAALIAAILGGAMMQ
ncbi:MAG: YIP1 family protein [Candidatus Woesearchaeota archaeon]